VETNCQVEKNDERFEESAEKNLFVFYSRMFTLTDKTVDGEEIAAGLVPLHGLSQDIPSTAAGVPG